MDMLCIAAAHDPIGYVAVAGQGLTETDIAHMTGGSELEASSLLGELDRNGVFSRDRHGRIYSRRMIKDARKAATARKNGKTGGNPKLSKDTGKPASDNHQDKGDLKPHKPEAKSQKLEPIGSGRNLAEVTARLHALQPPRHRRSTKPDILAALEGATRRGGEPGEIEAALGVYYATPDATKDDGQYAKAAHRLIERDRWRDWAPATIPQDTQTERLDHYRRTGLWRDTWGPRPDEAAA